ncbi:hypothetical protein ACLKA7_010081 [Drosophila subpalustris]
MFIYARYIMMGLKKASSNVGNCLFNPQRLAALGYLWARSLANINAFFRGSSGFNASSQLEKLQVAKSANWVRRQRSAAAIFDLTSEEVAQVSDLYPVKQPSGSLENKEQEQGAVGGPPVSSLEKTTHVAAKTIQKDQSIGRATGAVSKEHNTSDEPTHIKVFSTPKAASTPAANWRSCKWLKVPIGCAGKEAQPPSLI